MALALLLLVAPAARADVHLTRTVDWLMTGQAVATAESDANPDNRVLEIPRLILGTEARFDLRLDFERPALSLIARPRLQARVSWSGDGDDWSDRDADGVAEIVELYALWRASSSFTLAYGIQNFQWGPAESLGPSNRIFHQAGFDATPLTVWYGRHLVRANLSIGKSLSAVLLVEPTEPLDNDLPAFRAGEAFAPKLMGKVELSTEDGGAYLGVTAGGDTDDGRWFGEYGMWEMFDGFAVYADAGHTRGRSVWIPAASGWSLGRDEESWLTILVAGLRYTFEGGVDLRLEYLHDDAAWSEDELARAVAVAAGAARAGGPMAAALIGPYVAPGLELPGKDNLYASARFPDLGSGNRVTFSLRALANLHDGSAAGIAVGEWIVSDSAVVLLSLSATRGERDASLTRFFSISGLVASKVTL